MRNPKRIKPMLGLIENIWVNNPDLRLTQIILNCFENESIVYNTEDWELMQRLIHVYLGINDE